MSTDAKLAAPTPAWDIRAPALDTWFPIALALVTLVVATASMVVSLPLGLLVCAGVTLLLCAVRPYDLPLFITTTFLFQNLVIAAFTPLVPNESFFNTLRGLNFVIVAATFGIFGFAALNRSWSDHPEARRWLQAALLLTAVVTFYLGVGMVNGEPMNAIVYFRNTITPVACFVIAFMVAVLYRVDMVRGLAWLGAAAAAYGYCELFFTLDFLSLFNGDQYVKLQLSKQIESGHWEKVLEQTGFVFRGLADAFMTNLFNSAFLGDVLPKIWRITGPNFHPISYAYALSIISIVLLFRGRVLLPLFMLPLLVIVGSKGAMVLFLVAATALGIHRVLGPRLAVLFVAVAAAAWIGLAIVVGIPVGDYHVLGLFAGLRDFASNPLGEGLGIGGNISTDAARLDWDAAQAAGASDVPVESAVGVMLYQMGVGAMVFFGFLLAMAATLARRFVATSDPDYLAGFAMVVVLSANAVLQEEAYYSPLALGLVLLVTGAILARAIRPATAGVPPA